MYIKDLARTVGTSDSNLDRWAKQNKVNINGHTYPPSLVRSVCSFYEKHGRAATEQAFPNVRVRSIVERHKIYMPRQVRWEDEQIIEAARMAGLVSIPAQARFFNRPNANAGSIRSLWIKRFGFSGGSLNGMVHWYARELVVEGAPFLRPVGTGRRGEPVEFRHLILWVDMEKCLRPEVPDFIRDAIKLMAGFQRWLWQCERPKRKIIKMISDREIHPRPAAELVEKPPTCYR